MLHIYGDLAPGMVLHCGVLHRQALSYLPQLSSIPLAQHEGLHGINAVLVENILHAIGHIAHCQVGQQVPGREY